MQLDASFRHQQHHRGILTWALLSSSSLRFRSLFVECRVSLWFSGIIHPSSNMTDAGTSSVPTKIASAPSSEATSSSYPPCAQLCLADATATLPCAETNAACLCLHASAVKSSVTACLSSSNACSPNEALSAASFYDERCMVLGYPTSEGESAAGPIIIATGRPTAVPTRGPSPTASDASAPASHTSLSVPTIAGIAAGAAFLLICIITIVLYLYVRRRSTKPSNPTVTIESPDPSNPRNRLRKTVSLRQSALFSPDDPEWNEKLTHIATLTDSEKYLEHNMSYSHIERKKSLPQTPDTLTNNSFTFNPFDKEISTPVPRLPPPAYNNTPTPRTKDRPPSIIYPSPFNPRLLFERSISNLSNPISGRPSTPQVRAPSATQFSDKGSIYSATTWDTHSRSSSEASHGGQAHQEDTGDVEVARVSTLIMQRSRPTTLDFEALTPTTQVNLSGTLRPASPPFLSQFSSDTTVASAMPISKTGAKAPKPASLTLRTMPTAPTNPNPFSEPPTSPVSPISPTSVEMSALPDHSHTVSGVSFGRFDFEESQDRARESFMGNTDFGFGK